MNDLHEFAEVALAIFVALTFLIWLLTIWRERSSDRDRETHTSRYSTQKVGVLWQRLAAVRRRHLPPRNRDYVLISNGLDQSCDLRPVGGSQASNDR